MNNKVYCERCNKWFSPGSYVHHSCLVNAKTTMLTRKLQDKMKQKKLPVDLSGHNGEVPQPASESVEARMGQIRSEIYWLSEARTSHVASVIAAVRSALKSKRLKGKHRAFWAKKYTAVVQN